MESIFMEKSVKPAEEHLRDKLGPTYDLWVQLRDYLFNLFKDPAEEWNFPGKKYGWSYRIKQKKRNMIYFIPHDGYFNAALVFGPRAFDQIMESDVRDSIKDELRQARVYTEGRGVSIEVKSIDIFDDIKRLVQIKIDFWV